jgi:hypothetical protein
MCKAPGSFTPMSARELGPWRWEAVVHFSAQLEPRLTHENTLHTLKPKHPLNTGDIPPTRTPYPTESAQVQLSSGRV